MWLRWYSAVTAAACPLGRAWCRCYARHRPYLARFGPPETHFEIAPIWIHACSAGEVRTIEPLVLALQQRFPGTPLLVTASTSTGMALARRSFTEHSVAWCPFDAPQSVRAFFDRTGPRMLVLAETELWPNLIMEAARRAVPVVVVNGRLSDKHARRYRRFHRVFAELLPKVTAIGVQDETYAERFAALGANPQRIQVTGNLKFDAVATSIPARQRARLRAEMGIPEGARVLIFGSTRPGDEVLAASCWRMLRDLLPDLRLIVAPRHTARAEEIISAFGEPIPRRSLSAVLRPSQDSRVTLLDTTGELVAFYSLADVAVIGGSFYPGVNGHNPLEPAALGAATVFGPFMSNFAGPAATLLDARGAIQVQAPEDLGAVLLDLFEDASKRRGLGTRGRKAVLDHAGVVEHNVELIARVLGSS